MAEWEHGGRFSVDAPVCIAATDGAGRERLFRYGARPPFPLDRQHANSIPSNRPTNAPSPARAGPARCA
jgi:hypothetical protein